MCDVFGVFSYLVLLSLTLASVLYIIYLLVQCITLLRASAEVRVMKFARIAKLLLRVFRIT